MSEGAAIGIALMWAFGFVVVGSRLCWIYERREWNNGYCPHTGDKWRSFDVASDGSVGYTNGRRDRNRRTVWLSWYNAREAE